MFFEFHKNFKKEFKKIPKKVKDNFQSRLDILSSDRYNKLLNFHRLNGTEKDIYSINITSDVRAHFYFKSNECVVFLKIGSHSQLYK